ncbi:hypothetical protein LPJ64_004701 [Coemansia asiatica]|uniref:Transmembrane protein n=1 Tax=Coemansia asiatica TaxID=1052880 RepID=A0A9W7XIJ3_9FUNG|nr:hypothetical protein LPJ64_004701 [Coemansia asiatica]
MSLRTLPFRAFSRLFLWSKTQTHRFLYHNTEYLRDDLLTTSYFVPQRPLGLLRLAVFVYCLVVLVANLAVNIVHDAGWSWAAYFTTLTFFGITLYYGVAAYNTLRYRNLCCTRARISGVAGLPISQPMPLTSQQRKALMEEGRMGQMPGMLLSDPSIFTRDGSEASCYDDRDDTSGARGIEHAQLLVGSEHLNRRRCLEIQEIQVFPDHHNNNNNYSIIEDEQTKDALSSFTAEPMSQSSQQEQEQQQQQQLRRAEPADLPSVLHQSSLATQWLLYESFTCFAPLVTLIYWCLLYPTQDGFANALDIWMGVSMHACNSVLMVLEISVFARTRYRWTHIGAMYFILVLYLALVYFMVGVYDFYVYPFFDSRYFAGYVAVVCLLVLDVVAIIWVIMLMVHRLRDMLYPKWLSKRHSVFAF